MISHDHLNSSDNTHLRIKIYREFYHCIVYIANKERHIIIIHLPLMYPSVNHKDKIDYVDRMFD